MHTSRPVVDLDVIRNILEHVDPIHDVRVFASSHRRPWKLLCELCLVSKSLLQPAQKLLYRDAWFESRHGGSPLRRTLNANPELRLHIHRLFIWSGIDSTSVAMLVHLPNLESIATSYVDEILLQHILSIPTIKVFCLGHTMTLSPAMWTLVIKSWPDLRDLAFQTRPGAFSEEEGAEAEEQVEQVTFQSLRSLSWYHVRSITRSVFPSLSPNTLSTVAIEGCDNVDAKDLYDFVLDHRDSLQTLQISRNIISNNDPAYIYNKLVQAVSNARSIELVMNAFSTRQELWSSSSIHVLPPQLEFVTIQYPGIKPEDVEEFITNRAIFEQGGHLQSLEVWGLEGFEANQAWRRAVETADRYKTKLSLHDKLGTVVLSTSPSRQY